MDLGEQSDEETKGEFKDYENQRKFIKPVIPGLDLKQMNSTETERQQKTE
jgi:hypothetical protein